MRYGKYKISLSIGYSNANRESTITISDYVTEKDWKNMSKEEHETWMDEAIGDMLGQYIEYGYAIVD